MKFGVRLDLQAEFQNVRGLVQEEEVAMEVSECDWVPITSRQERVNVESVRCKKHDRNIVFWLYRLGWRWRGGRRRTAMQRYSNGWR